MQKIFSVFLGLGMVLGMATGPVQARGRRPENRDSYPDYNKLDMRRKSNTQKETSSSTATGPVVLPRPTGLNPSGSPVEDDLVPQAPPKAVYMSDDASEPPLPDAIKDTLLRGTTN